MPSVAALRRAVWTPQVLCVLLALASPGALQAASAAHGRPAAPVAMAGLEGPHGSAGICSGIAGRASSDAAQEQEKLRRWRSDLQFIVQQIESRHPNPWFHTSRAEFTRRVEQFEQALSECSEEALIVRAMQLVASLGDGHTALTPFNHPLAPEWFPIRIVIHHWLYSLIK